MHSVRVRKTSETMSWTKGEMWRTGDASVAKCAARWSDRAEEAAGQATSGYVPALRTTKACFGLWNDSSIVDMIVARVF
jgi:hypothetical protein